MPQYEAALLMMGCDIKETAGEERETYQTKRLKESFDIITHGLTINSARPHVMLSMLSAWRAMCYQ